MINICLQLMTGVDIPIQECCVILHQPTIKEISLLGEKDFLIGAQCLCVNKDVYQGQGKEQLEAVSNFQLLMSLLAEAKLQDQKQKVIQVLQLLFPSYQIFLTPRAIVLKLNDENFTIDESNFDFFQDICKQVFCMNKGENETFNPANKKAKEIADKIMRGRRKVAALKAADQKQSSVLAQYISVLSVGLQCPVETITSLTMFQLYDLIERYQLYLKWDIQLKSIMAGAKPEKETEDWMKSIH